ncbi:MAG: D-Ala-D-Ala carboxypeptidase family metallohydrolase [Chthoniobacterales bacterium]
MNSLGRKSVDGLELDALHRAVLKPGEPMHDEHGNAHYLPRFFLEVPSWPAARELRVAAHFKLAELMMVDCREAQVQLQSFPHYVPCAIVVLARYLEAFRLEAGIPVFISANGGYRSPAHQLSASASRHHWATAADIYRVGDTYLDDEKAIDRYARIATSLGPEVFVRPYAQGDDHLHVDIGFVTLAPRECSESV